MGTKKRIRTSLARGAGSLVAVATLALACSDSQGPAGAGKTPLPSPFVVSGPVPAPPSASVDVARLESSASPVVYVSLPPGAIPDGRTVTILDSRAGSIASTVMVAGGFDPIPVTANVGDTLAIRVQVGGAGAPVSYTVAVPEGAPPIVVRTSPPPHKRDVPLNASMVVVFSQPLDPATLTTGSVQLWHSLALVAGTVRFSDATNLRAEFHPDTLLAGNTDYRLVVTPAIHDVNGVALGLPTEVAFTTGETVQVATRLVFLNVSGSVGVAQPFGVQVALVDSLGATVQGAGDSVTLTLGANPGGATLTGTKTVAAVDGIANFLELSLDRAGAAYTLVATSGTLAGATSPPLTVLEPSTGLVFASVSVGSAHSCGVTTAGAAYCWGANGGGQLGVGATMPVAESPVPVAGGLRFTEVSASVYSTCGRTAAGAAYCWGDGPTGLSPTPVPVAVGFSFASLSAGGGHTCGVTGGGDAYCWGYNEFGQLGAGDTTNRSSPVLVTGGLSFTSVDAGFNHTCGLTTTGSAYCWGQNTNGQLGDGTTTDRSRPVPVAGDPSFASVSGGALNSCGLTTAGTAYCWGLGAYGQLGDGAYIDRATPVPVAGGLSFATLSAGDWNACGVTVAGAAYCWGANDWGDLGNGSLGSENTPTPVAGGLSFAVVNPGYYHSCGVTVAGVAYCWGWGHGLGDGEPVLQTLVPVKVGGQP